MLVQQFFDVKTYAKFINKNVIPFYALLEEETGQELRERFGYGGGPSVIFVKHDGSLHDILTSYKDADSYLERVKKTLKGIDTYAYHKARYDANLDDLLLMYSLADKHFRMWQTDKGVALCKSILERPEEAKDINVKYQGIDINLYEIARFGVASTVWWTEQSSRGMEDFKAEFPKSKLMSRVDANLARYYLELPVSKKYKIFFNYLAQTYPDDSRMLTQFIQFAVENEWQLEKAETFSRNLIAKEPGNRQYRQAAVRVFLKQNKSDGISTIFGEDYIKEHWDDTSILNSYAWFWALEEQNFQSALKAIHKAAELNPEDANLLDTMSMVYWKMKDYKKAIKVEEKANTMNPSVAYLERIEAIKEDMAQNK